MGRHQTYREPRRAILWSPEDGTAPNDRSSACQQTEGEEQNALNTAQRRSYGSLVHDIEEQLLHPAARNHHPLGQPTKEGSRPTYTSSGCLRWWSLRQWPSCHASSCRVSALRQRCVATRASICRCRKLLGLLRCRRWLASRGWSVHSASVQDAIEKAALSTSRARVRHASISTCASRYGSGSRRLVAGAAAHKLPAKHRGKEG